jgi:prepilin-type N-terminal cleavage/methylation domain-containing protein
MEKKCRDVSLKHLKKVPVPKLKKLTSGTGTEVNKKIKAFTLVELIVTITILTIL